MIEFNNLAKTQISRNFIKGIVQKILKKLKIKKAEISVALVDKKTIRKLNRDYRGINRITDVLSFDYQAPTIDERLLTIDRRQLSMASCSSSVIIGEIIICYPQAKQQAKEQKHSIKKEIEFLLVHGLMHLRGYDHKKPKIRNDTKCRPEPSKRARDLNV